MKPQLIVALDVPASDRILPIVRALPQDISFYKVGLELFAAEGPTVIDVLTREGKKVFLDLKLHDIPRTVARAVTSAARHGVAFLTVHACGGEEMLKAAAQAAAESGPDPPQLLAVTVLTSLNNSDLQSMGIARSTDQHAAALGALAVSAGIDGLVCSPAEVARFRQELGDAPVLVTPGVRPAGADVGDQKRAATPSAAVQAGSNFLVVGRPILQAPDPAAAAKAILEEMEQAVTDPPTA